jgi:hypothetical protein
VKLSKAQCDLFWSLWAAACRYQGWTRDRGLTSAEIDIKRKALLAACGFGSLKDVDKTAGFDAVKARLLALQDDVDGASEVDHPEIGAARRWRQKIEDEIMPGIARFKEDAIGYAERIARDKFGLPEHWVLDLDDLKPSDIHDLMVTLSARLETMAGKTAF